MYVGILVSKIHFTLPSSLISGWHATNHQSTMMGHLFVWGCLWRKCLSRTEALSWSSRCSPHCSDNVVDHSHKWCLHLFDILSVKEILKINKRTGLRSHIILHEVATFDEIFWRLGKNNFVNFTFLNINFKIHLKRAFKNWTFVTCFHFSFLLV